MSRQVLIPTQIEAAGPMLGGVVHALHGLTMGTTWSVKLVAGPGQLPARWSEGIQQQLDTVVAQMSTWDASSDLARFNLASPGHRQVLPEAFFNVLRHGLSVAEASDGAYDPTAGALVNLWGFGPTRRFDEPGFSVPTRQAVAEALGRGGWKRLELDEDTREARQPGGLRLDLSAIAKGFAVDQVVRYLQSVGVAHCLVEVGGELCGAGLRPDGQPWWVALETPECGPDDRGNSPALPDTVVALHGLSVATSGDYRRYFMHNGTRHAHTVDPRHGWPVGEGVASVTVLHADCMAADAWSTALTVLGPEQGLERADAQGLMARFVLRDRSGRFTERTSRAFLALRA